MSDGSNTSQELDGNFEANKSLRSEGDVDVPEFVYIDLEPRFASIVLTVPDLQVDIPENPKPASDGGELSIKLRNNGRLRIDPNGYNQLNGIDWSARQVIESVNWNREEISGENLISRRKELLEKFFEERLEGHENVEHLREMMRAAGLSEGSYLYRAISDSEYRELMKTGQKLVK